MNNAFAAAPSADLSTAAAAAPRFDMYAPIHKALRMHMTQTLQRVGCADPGDDADVADAVAHTLELLQALRCHLAHENDFLHPAMEARAPGSAARTGADHDEHVASIDALEAEARALAAAPAARREAAALRLYRHLALFVAENMQHMHVEETANNRVLWAGWSDAELVALHDALVASIPPDEMAATMHWMVPAISHAELAGMLGGARAQMPAEAFDAMLSLVRSRLAPARWAKLQAALAGTGTGTVTGAPQPVAA